MLSLVLECGTSTVGNNARLALRMRVNMSEIGSVISKSFLGLPTGFRDARDQSVQRGFAEREARTIELAQVTMAAAAGGAAIHQTHWARVTRQFRQAGVIAFR